MKDGDMSINSPLMWLQGGVGDQGIQSLNFQGYGVTPWMQPRLDASIPGLQPDVYQAMAAAALQEMRTVDSSKLASQSLLQFQQSQNVSNGTASMIPRQMLQQSQAQNALLQSFQENQASAQAQLLQQQLQRQHSYNEQRQQQQQVQQSQQLHQLSVQPQISNVISTLPHLASSSQSQPPTLQAVASQCQQSNFSDSLGNPIASSDVSSMHTILGSLSQAGASHLLNSNASNPIISSSAMLTKQVTVDNHVPSTVSQCILPQVEQLGAQQSNVSELASLLPPFPGREYSSYHGSGDPQNNLLFGVSIDSSLMGQNGLPNLKNISSENESLSLPYAASNFTNNVGTDFPLNSDMTTSSCVDESGFLQSSENVDQVNPPTRTFVKVNKLAYLLQAYQKF